MVNVVLDWIGNKNGISKGVIVINYDKLMIIMKRSSTVKFKNKLNRTFLSLFTTLFFLFLNIAFFEQFCNVMLKEKRRKQ